MISFRSLIIFISFLIILFCTYHLFIFEQQRRAIKDDLIELSKIKYGLFSVDEWKQILSRIISKKIEELNFSPDQKVEMSAKVSGFLLKTITDFEDRFYDEKSQSFLGILQGGITSLTGMFDKLKEDVPVFTEQILDFLNDPANRDKVNEYIMHKLDEYTETTFSKIDYTEHNRIIAAYKLGDRTKTIVGLQFELDRLQRTSGVYIILIYVVVLLSGLMIVLTPSFTRIAFIFYCFICLCLLGAGLMFPMIEIDARIAEMNFSLLGESVAFTDQVLYYKSKSILEVVQLMFSQDKWDVLIVGVLVLVFSVLFPVSKLLSSIAYLYNPRLHTNRFVHFVIFKTGKWSMADVMVVAIFMSYIGFSGILTEQLNQLEGITRNLDVLTTNKSSLQMGFFLFTSFAILSLLLAQKLQDKKIISSN